MFDIHYSVLIPCVYFFSIFFVLIDPFFQKFTDFLNQIMSNSKTVTFAMILTSGWIRINITCYIPTSIINEISRFHGSYDTNFNSNIIRKKNKRKFMEFICNKLNNHSIKLNRLYSGKKHGFKASIFHEKCDKKGPTITLVLNQFNTIFGGYAQLSWRNHGTSRTDLNAWLFQFKPKMKIFTQKGNDGKSVYHGKDYMSNFGGGGDLKIGNNCNNDLTSVCWPYSYTIKHASQLIGGNDVTSHSIYFKVKDVEVFQAKSCL